MWKKLNSNATETCDDMNTHKKKSVNRKNRTLNCNRNHCIKKTNKKLFQTTFFGTLLNV